MTGKATSKTKQAYGSISTVRHDRKKRTRQELIRAARDLFHERGYAATTIDDIARSANVGRATFYLHFATKVEIIIELQDALVHRLKGVYRQLAALGEAPQAALEGWVRSFLQFCEDERESVWVLYQTMMIEAAFPNSNTNIYQGLIELLGEDIPSFDTAARGTDKLMRAEAYLILLQLEGLPRQLMIYQGSIDRDPLVAAIAARLYRFIHTPFSDSAIPSDP